MGFQEEKSTSNFYVQSAFVLLSGAPQPSLDAFFYPHDIIKFTLRCKENIFEVSKSFYELGCNLKEIARLTGFARTSIRTALIEGGVVIREYVPAPSLEDTWPKVSKRGVAPFGYAYRKNQLVMDTKEFKVVLSIYSMWLKGMSLKAIVIHLNWYKIPTRHGKKWNKEKVKTIIERHNRRVI